MHVVAELLEIILIFLKYLITNLKNNINVVTVYLLVIYANEELLQYR